MKINRLQTGANKSFIYSVQTSFKRWRLCRNLCFIVHSVHQSLVVHIYMFIKAKLTSMNYHYLFDSCSGETPVIIFYLCIYFRFLKLILRLVIGLLRVKSSTFYIVYQEHYKKQIESKCFKFIRDCLNTPLAILCCEIVIQ